VLRAPMNTRRHSLRSRSRPFNSVVVSTGSTTMLGGAPEAGAAITKRDQLPRSCLLLARITPCRLGAGGVLRVISRGWRPYPLVLWPSASTYAPRLAQTRPVRELRYRIICACCHGLMSHHLLRRARAGRWPDWRPRPGCRGGRGPGCGGGGPGCRGPGRGRPGPRPARAGRWPG
jgi:hypothetical protein